MCKKWEKAYMTVEAALVFPMILGGIVFIIYLGIYLYNASVMKQTAYIAALRGSQLITDSLAEVEEYVKEELDSLLDSKILTKESIQQEIKISHGKIKVKLSMNFTLPLVGEISSELIQIEKEAEVVRCRPVYFIRKVRKGYESQISK